MAADLTANLARRHEGSGKLIEYALGAVHVYEGSILMVLRGTGYAVKAAQTALGRIIGVCTGEVDNSGGSAGDKKVQVRAGAIEFVNKASAAITDIGVLATAVDDNDCATGGVEVVNVGRIVGLDPAAPTTCVLVDFAAHDIDSHAT